MPFLAAARFFAGLLAVVIAARFVAGAATLADDELSWRGRLRLFCSTVECEADSESDGSDTRPAAVEP